MTALSGPEKAMLFLLGIDRKVAQTLLAELDDDEIQKLTSHFEKLNETALQSVPAVFQEFADEMRKPRLFARGGGAYLQNMLTSALGPERAGKFLPQGQQRSSRWRAFTQLSPEASAGILGREHPQAVALLLSQIEEQIAGKILKALPKAMMFDVVGRIASLANVSEDAIKELEEVLNATLGAPSVTDGKIDGVGKAAALVNSFDADTATDVLNEIGGNDKALADAIRNARFTVEDLANADTRGLQLLLREIDNERLLLALKTVSEAVREKLLGAVSSRVADSIRGELQVMGPVRLKDVEAAQREIVEAALRLEKEGKLMISGRAGEPLV